MLEKMDEFFKNRVNGYDRHMMTNIEGAGEFYAYTASLLPGGKDARVLDLGCGTGLELGEYFRLNPDARITGIDLSEAMLSALSEKFSGRNIELIKGSYFDTPLGSGVFDAAVSVESLHHFTGELKLGLYTRLHEALRPGGYFILTDYFAESDELEKQYFRELAQIKRDESVGDDEFYHYDTPLTVAHETEILKQAGFSGVTVKRNWGATCTVAAYR